MTRLTAASSILIWAIPIQSLSAQQSCESLTSLHLPYTTITSSALLPEAPARCVVKGVARPTRDSEIKFEVWLPAANWNGKYLQAGNGGWAGRIPTQALAEPLKRGYAAAGTDNGHDAAAKGASWATGHPEKLVDFGYRAVHETSLQAKAIIHAFYGRDPVRSYFMGCSDGGREALMEAQRYAEDFNGIVAGAPANNWSHLFAGFVWNEQALLKGAIPPAKLQVIQKSALAACDSLDGLKDGLIEDPRRCHFDPSVLACKGADNAECLMAGQVEAVRKIYSGPSNPRTGAQIFPGYSPGAEAAPGAWAVWIIPASSREPAQFGFGNSFYGQVVFEDTNWDFRKLNFDTGVAFADAKAGPILNATSPDLRSFRASGGKLIQYHGWGDPAIAPLSSIEYYDQVRSFLAKYPDPRGDSSRPIQDFYRLFMVPGMGHCGGGFGPNSFGNGFGGASARVDPEHDVLSALEQWVEAGVAPDKIVGTGAISGDPSTKMTRPLCPYPQTAAYNGAGNPNDAGSFACAPPR